MTKKISLARFAAMLSVVLLTGCQRQPAPSATPSPAPSAAAPSPTPSIEPTLLDDGLDAALQELEAVE